ncbi:MAG: sortase, partial [Patescibacteria group bacterium]
FAKFLSIGVVVLGILLFSYTFFPLISWQIYFAPVFASQKIQAPIPNGNVINSSNIGDLISMAASSVGADYTNAYNWYPGLGHKNNVVANYTISIPKLNIQNAVVTNENSDLTKHLVQFNADSVPPKEGNSIIFGHSTLPQLFDPKNYKTIFATVYKLTTGDEIIVESNNIKYNYKVENITVVEPTDTSVLAQNYSDSFITIITCTPPGTTWKRLVVKARLEKI